MPDLKGQPFKFNVHVNAERIGEELKDSEKEEVREREVSAEQRANAPGVCRRFCGRRLCTTRRSARRS